MHKSNTIQTNRRLLRHPCFNNYDFHNAIIHLPVASECNIACNYELHSTCCHSRKAVMDGILITPFEAAERYNRAMEKISNLTVAAIAGPGEPLAGFEVVKETIRLVRQINPDVILCLSTNGLMLPVYANHLISLGVNHITVAVNTVNPDTGAKLYDKITYLGHDYTGTEGANILLQNQIAGISYLAAMGVFVRLNITVIKGVNDHELKDIARMAKEAGCNLMNLVGQVPGINREAGFTREEMNNLRRECEKIIPQSYYCKPCNAASIETLNSRLSIDFNSIQKDLEYYVQKKQNYRFAICSRNGKLVDEHFGRAAAFYIYEYLDGVIHFMETRPVGQYCFGSMEEKEAGRIYGLIRVIEDCNCIICLRIGICPSNALKEKNIDIYTTYSLIEDGIREAVTRLYTGPFF